MLSILKNLPMVKTHIFDLLKSCVASWDEHFEIINVSPVIPDASLRSYYRIFLSSSKTEIYPSTAIAMVFESLKSPEAGKVSGRKTLPADEIYLLTTDFFRSNNVSVPVVYFNDCQRHILLIEDLGDNHLANFLEASEEKGEAVKALYCSAIDQIFRIQSISFDKSLLPFQRRMDSNTYFLELTEVLDFAIPQGKIDNSERQILEKTFKDLAEALDVLPEKLAHRDFHSWNLLIDNQGQIRVIDFQDALIAPVTYDIAGLLNDRDTDSMLGKKLYHELLEYFRMKIGMEENEFYYQYYLSLLQRDLKVIGRFHKLASTRQLAHYLRWVPGTSSRVGRGLDYLLNTGNIAKVDFREMKKLLAACFAEIK